MKLRTSFAQNERGAILVEMALVVPILAILLMGTVQFGLVLREHQIVQNAAREGARFCSQQTFDTLNNKWTAPTESQVRKVVSNYLKQENILVDANSPDISVEPNYDLGPSIGKCGSRVKVTHTTSPIVGSGIWGNFTYSAEAVFRNLSATPC
jgi:Flp pilus assembly protein TadG